MLDGQLPTQHQELQGQQGQQEQQEQQEQQLNVNPPPQMRLALRDWRGQFRLFRSRLIVSEISGCAFKLATSSHRNSLRQTFSLNNSLPVNGQNY